MPSWPQGVRTIASTAFKVPIRFHYAVARACGEGWDLADRYPVTASVPRGGWRAINNTYLVGSVDQRSQGDRSNRYPGRCHHSDKALGAGKGSPHAHTGLLGSQSKGGWAGASYPLTLGLLAPCPAVSWAGSGTFKAVLTQALELIFARGHACGTVPAGLALTGGAVVALPHTVAAQEVVGEVQPLAIHRHLA